MQQTQYKVDRLPGGERYTLPPRDVNELRKAGWLVTLFSLLIVGFMCLWMGLPLTWGIPMLLSGQWFGLLLIGFAMLGLGGMIPGVKGLLLGLALLTNRSWCLIDIRRGRLIVREKLFIGHWRWKRPIEGITRLSIEGARDPNAARGAKEFDIPGLPKDLLAIIADGPGIKKMPIGIGYHHDLLTRLAEELAERIEANIVPRGSEARGTLSDSARPLVASAASASALHAADAVRPRVQVTDAANADDDGTVYVPDQPAGSTVQVERRDDGLTLTIPPAGLWKGSKGLFLFSILWNAFVSVFVILMILTELGVVQSSDGDTPGIIGLLFMIPFIAVGVGTMLAAINMGRRKTIIDVVHDVLLISRKNIFGMKQHEWTAEQIESIEHGPSNMSVNDQPIYELQIHPVSGKKVGLLSERNDDELRWIVAELNQALNLRTPRTAGFQEKIASQPRDVTGRVTPPSGTRIEASHFDDGFHLKVPALGWRSAIVGIVVGFVFMLIGVAVTAGVLYSQLQGGIQGADLCLVAFISIWGLGFGGGGGAVFFGMLAYARRRVDIDVLADQLLLHRRGPLGTKKKQWQISDIESITVEDSGTKMGNQTWYQLRITPKQGKAFNIMTGWSTRELAYVAAVLNDVLGIGEVMNGE